MEDRIGIPIFECNSRCSCNAASTPCRNRLVQYKSPVVLQVRRTELLSSAIHLSIDLSIYSFIYSFHLSYPFSIDQIFRTKHKGWGVRSTDPISKGTFVCEYVGEVITSEEAERRGVEYDAAKTSYLFDLDLQENEDCLT